MRLLVVTTLQTVSCSRLRYWVRACVRVFLLVRCEVFVYPSTVAQEQLKVNYFVNYISVQFSVKCNLKPCCVL
jgi:hypothetical protein